jgi:hypothetical protein
MLMICKNAKICVRVACKNQSPHERDGFCSYKCSLGPLTKDDGEYSKCVPYQKENMYGHNGSITIAVQTRPDDDCKLLQSFKLGNTLVEKLGVYKEECVTVWVVRDNPKEKRVMVCDTCHNPMSECICRDMSEEIEELDLKEHCLSLLELPWEREFSTADEVIVSKLNEVIRWIKRHKGKWEQE